MTKLVQSVINKIKQERIMPIPRWQFVILHILLWFAFVIAIVLGALAFSVIFRLVGGVDWEIARRAGHGTVRGFFLVLPYLWLLTLTAVLYLAGKLFEKTKKGYLYTHTIIVLLSIIISLIIGMVFYFAGVGHFIERGLMNHIRPYARWSERHDSGMVAPDDGVLIGKVIDIKEDRELMIIDFRGEQWVVDISSAVYKGDFKPLAGYPVGIIGERMGQGIFKAEKIMPWKPDDQMPPPPVGMFFDFNKMPHPPMKNLPPVSLSE
jgi:hypothetical protein